MNFVVNPKQVCAIIPTAPSDTVTSALRRYLERHRFGAVMEITPYADGSYDPVVVMRNKAIRDIVLGSLKTWEHFVFFDNDIRPDARLDPMFEVQADVVGATYDLNNPGRWIMPDSVHCGAMRFHRRVIEAMQPPYFMHEYSDDGMEFRKCDCLYFRDKVRAAGFSILRAGWTEHGNAKSWC